MSYTPEIVEKILFKAYEIRKFEESLDEQFKNGIIHGTFHRCIGQELTAVISTYFLNSETDFIVSNHRNHGHYLGFTNDFEGLANELMGKESGVTSGIGGSQLIFGKNFISNGILGSTVPIAVGLAFANKLKGDNGIVVCFIGDGALGEGQVYEAFNLASLFQLKILFIVENNFWAQSTPIHQQLSGKIEDRFKAFDIQSFTIESKNIEDMISGFLNGLKYLNFENKPTGIIFKVERLGPHSKGDDTRTSEYIEKVQKNDILNQIFKISNDLNLEIDSKIKNLWK
jgi:TPP-dependent pyruvate/acetoin dehydrogenase alpha subunit